MKTSIIKYFVPALLLVGCLGLASCKKYLDAKPDQTLTVPSSLKDLWAIIDNNSTMNLKYAMASDILADNYYVTSDSWASVTTDTYRAHYIWQKNDNTNTDWNNYGAIYYANVALESLAKINVSATQQIEADNVKGSALFFRGFYFYSLSQIFAPPYNQSTRSTKYGIPLRLNTNFAEQSVRSTVEETYTQMLADLKSAAPLLPSKPLVKTRPSQPAAWGMIAKVYLSMQQYDSAGVYANKCLMAYDSLLNFNKDVTVSAAAPFKRFNKEVIFHARSATASILASSRARIDTILYKSYSTNDLRKQAYFKANTGVNAGSYSFKGDYDGSGTSSGFVFGGVVTDDIYLIRAECYARSGNTAQAMADLNKLLASRMTASFTPITASGPGDALAKVLTERRKELLFRGTRWTDLRRLKDDPIFSVTPQRNINGQLYDLKPNNPRYTIAIPGAIINLSGMEQNP